MKFLCLAYPGCGFSPGPDLVAEYAPPARPCGRPGYSSTAVSSAPATPPRLSGPRATARPKSARWPCPYR